MVVPEEGRDVPRLVDARGPRLAEALEGGAGHGELGDLAGRPHEVAADHEARAVEAVRAVHEHELAGVGGDGQEAVHDPEELVHRRRVGRRPAADARHLLVKKKKRRVRHSVSRSNAACCG